MTMRKYFTFFEVLNFDYIFLCRFKAKNSSQPWTNNSSQSSTFQTAASTAAGVAVGSIIVSINLIFFYTFLFSLKINDFLIHIRAKQLEVHLLATLIMYLLLKQNLKMKNHVFLKYENSSNALHETKI